MLWVDIIDLVYFVLGVLVGVIVMNISMEDKDD